MDEDGQVIDALVSAYRDAGPGDSSDERSPR